MEPPRLVGGLGPPPASLLLLRKEQPPAPQPSLQGPLTSALQGPLPAAGAGLRMEPSKERRIVETISYVTANLARLSAALAAAIDRATQEAMIRQDLNAGIDIHHSERVSDTPPPLPSSSSSTTLPSLGAPAPSHLLHGFEDLPENFLESNDSNPGPSTTITLAPMAPMAAVSAASAPQPSASVTAIPQYIIKLDQPGREASTSASQPSSAQPSSSGTLPPAAVPTPILVAQNGLQYVKVELGGAGKPVVVSNSSLPSNFIQSMLSTSRSGSEKTITVAPSRDAEGRLVMRPVAASGGAQATPGPSPSKAKSLAEPSNASSSASDDGEDIYIETRDLCKRIAYELKQHSIPQAVFAEKVLCRSQGTLSDLLRNPKPWNKLKSGRETFRRMYAWLKQPLQQRLESLELWRTGQPGQPGGPVGPGGPTTPVREGESKLARMEAELKMEVAEEEEQVDPASDGLRSPPRFAPTQPTTKRPRLVFTDIQKRTLQAIFKETQRPSKEMQQTISEHLGLDLSTVQNFFMNARRRYRLGPAADGPAPNQQLRPITPPPASPPPDASSTALVGRPPKKRRLSEGLQEEVVEETTVTDDFLIHPGKTIFQTGSDGVVAPLGDPGAPTPPAYSLEEETGSGLPGVQEVLEGAWASAATLGGGLGGPLPQGLAQTLAQSSPSNAAAQSPKKRILIGYSAAASANPPL